MSAWQPIETAPKEPLQHVLLWLPDDECVAVGYLDDGLESGSWQLAWSDDTAVSPSHWMPLPEPPA